MSGDNEWRRLPGEFRQYEMDTSGRVRHRKLLLILKPQMQGKSAAVGLYSIVDGKQKQRSVRKLHQQLFPEVRVE